jgi:hypothetical protein
MLGFSIDFDDKLAELAQSLHTARQRRAECLPGQLFAEPAWDILLKLFIAAVKDERITQAELCSAVGFRAEIGARWIAIVISQNLAEKIDPADGSDAEVRLTCEGFWSVRRSLYGFYELLGPRAPLEDQVPDTHGPLGNAVPNMDNWQPIAGGVAKAE